MMRRRGGRARRGGDGEGGGVGAGAGGGRGGGGGVAAPSSPPQPRSRPPNPPICYNVGTGLPPMVQGPLQGELELHMPWMKLDRAFTPVQSRRYQSEMPEADFVARVVAWGEQGGGTRLLPTRVTSVEGVNDDQRSSSNCAVFPVRCDKSSIRSYLSDMGHVCVEICTQGGAVMARAVVSVEGEAQGSGYIIDGQFPLLTLDGAHRAGFLRLKLLLRMGASESELMKALAQAAHARAQATNVPARRVAAPVKALPEKIPADPSELTLLPAGLAEGSSQAHETDLVEFQLNEAIVNLDEDDQLPQWPAVREARVYKAPESHGAALRGATGGARRRRLSFDGDLSNLAPMAEAEEGEVEAASEELRVSPHSTEPSQTLSADSASLADEGVEGPPDDADRENMDHGNGNLGSPSNAFSPPRDDGGDANNDDKNGYDRVDGFVSPARWRGTNADDEEKLLSELLRQGQELRQQMMAAVDEFGEAGLGAGGDLPPLPVYENEDGADYLDYSSASALEFEKQELDLLLRTAGPPPASLAFPSLSIAEAARLAALADVRFLRLRVHRLIMFGSATATSQGCGWQLRFRLPVGLRAPNGSSVISVPIPARNVAASKGKLSGGSHLRVRRGFGAADLGLGEVSLMYEIMCAVQLSDETAAKWMACDERSRPPPSLDFLLVDGSSREPQPGSSSLVSSNDNVTGLASLELRRALLDPGLSVAATIDIKEVSNFWQTDERRRRQEGKDLPLLKNPYRGPGIEEATLTLGKRAIGALAVSLELLPSAPAVPESEQQGEEASQEQDIHVERHEATPSFPLEDEARARVVFEDVAGPPQLPAQGQQEPPAASSLEPEPDPRPPQESAPKMTMCQMLVRVLDVSHLDAEKILSGKAARLLPPSARGALDRTGVFSSLRVSYNLGGFKGGGLQHEAVPKESHSHEGTTDWSFPKGASSSVPVVLRAGEEAVWQDRFQLFEVWGGLDGVAQEILVGLCRAPLGLWSVGLDPTTQLPLVASQGALPIVNPFSGDCLGTLNVYIALGTVDQVAVAISSWSDPHLRSPLQNSADAGISALFDSTVESESRDDACDTFESTAEVVGVEDKDDEYDEMAGATEEGDGFGGAVCHVFEFSVRGEMPLPRPKDFPSGWNVSDDQAMGCAISYSLLGGKHELWWDADSAILNSRDRHRVRVRAGKNELIRAWATLCGDCGGSGAISLEVLWGSEEASRISLGSVQLSAASLMEALDGSAASANMLLPIDLAKDAPVGLVPDVLPLIVTHRREPLAVARRKSRTSKLPPITNSREVLASSTALETTDASKTRPPISSPVYSPPPPSPVEVEKAPVVPLLSEVSPTAMPTIDKEEDAASAAGVLSPADSFSCVTEYVNRIRDSVEDEGDHQLPLTPGEPMREEDTISVTVERALHLDLPEQVDVPLLTTYATCRVEVDGKSSLYLDGGIPSTAELTSPVVASSNSPVYEFTGELPLAGANLQLASMQNRTFSLVVRIWQRTTSLWVPAGLLGDSVLGCAVVPLSPLQRGPIDGWYHILDEMQRPRGQVKVRIASSSPVCGDSLIDAELEEDLITQDGGGDDSAVGDEAWAGEVFHDGDVWGPVSCVMRDLETLLARLSSSHDDGSEKDEPVKEQKLEPELEPQRSADGETSLSPIQRGDVAAELSEDYIVELKLDMERRLSQLVAFTRSQSVSALVVEEIPAGAAAAMSGSCAGNEEVKSHDGDAASASPLPLTALSSVGSPSIDLSPASQVAQAPEDSGPLSPVLVLEPGSLTHAAEAIQSAWRRWKVEIQQHHAATTMQALVRGKLSRKIFARMRAEKLQQRFAARKLQSAWSAWQERATSAAKENAAAKIIEAAYIKRLRSTASPRTAQGQVESEVAAEDDTLTSAEEEAEVAVEAAEEEQKKEENLAQEEVTKERMDSSPPSVDVRVHFHGNATLVGKSTFHNQLSPDPRRSKPLPETHVAHGVLPGSPKPSRGSNQLSSSAAGPRLGPGLFRPPRFADAETARIARIMQGSLNLCGGLDSEEDSWAE